VRTLNLGILAHVDAGKTSLTERLLFAAGVIDEAGSVDDGTTQTDSLALERQRGITIKTAVASFAIGEVSVNLIDTPGHPDFIAEVERALSVLDGAVLVISAVEGVQPQTRILMRALQRLHVPTLLFVNKIDRRGAGYEGVLRAISELKGDVPRPPQTGTKAAPRDGADADTLFKHADAALHLAKQQGRNGFQFFTADMGAAAARRLMLLGDLRHALEREEFRVHYQPQMRLAGGGISGAEALLRWRHPLHGSVRPSEFIPLLEETGLIVPVGEWVLSRVCRDMAVLGDYGLAPPRVAVNLSARQFRQHDLAARIERIMEEEHMPAGRLTLEITESLLMGDPEGSVRTLQRLKAIGVHVALDDFGTGYSSLSYLKKFPIDELKIDKSFVDGVAHSREDAAIIDAAIHMAHNLGMQVVAEGVEDRQQWDFLRTHGCDHVQGYLTGKPLAFDGFLHRMRSGCVGAAILPPNGAEA